MLVADTAVLSIAVYGSLLTRQKRPATVSKETHIQGEATLPAGCWLPTLLCCLLRRSRPCVYTCVHTHTHTHTSTHTHTHTWGQTNEDVIYTCIHTYVRMYIHTHTHTPHATSHKARRGSPAQAREYTPATQNLISQCPRIRTT
jgi:hypothetical protein